MDIQNFFTDQLVGVTDLMGVQTVPQALFERHGKYVAMKGAALGLEVTANSPSALNVLVSAGHAFIGNGVSSDLTAQATVSCAVDKDAVSTTVSVAGESRWLSIFAVNQKVSDTPVTRPDAVVINYLTHDRVQLVVVQGGSAVNPTKPALDAYGTDAVLLADVKRTYGQTVITASDIDTSRVTRSKSVGDLYNLVNNALFPVGTYSVSQSTEAPPNHVMVDSDTVFSRAAYPELGALTANLSSVYSGAVPELTSWARPVGLAPVAMGFGLVQSGIQYKTHHGSLAYNATLGYILNAAANATQNTSGVPDPTSFLVTTTDFLHFTPLSVNSATPSRIFAAGDMLYLDSKISTNNGSTWVTPAQLQTFLTNTPMVDGLWKVGSTYYVAARYSSLTGQVSLYYSNDLTNWSEVTTGTKPGYCAGGSAFFGASGPKVFNTNKLVGGYSNGGKRVFYYVLGTPGSLLEPTCPFSGSDTWALDVVAVGSTYICIGDLGSVVTTTDFVTMTARPAAPNITSIASDGTTAIGWGSGGAYSTTDGINWTALATQPAVPLQDIVYLGGKWISYARSSVWFSPSPSGRVVQTSTNGTSWTVSTMTPWYEGHAVAFNKLYVFATDYNVSASWGTHGLFTTTDALTWTYTHKPFPNPPTTGFNMQSYGPNPLRYVNDRLIFVGAQSDYARIRYTTDGTNWNILTPTGAAQNDVLNAVAYGNGTWVAVGGTAASGPLIYSSTDFTSWTSRAAASGITLPVRDVMFVGGKFVAVTYSSGVMTSTDGITWTKQTCSGTWAFDRIYHLPSSNKVLLWASTGTLGTATSSASDLATWTTFTHTVMTNANGCCPSVTTRDGRLVLYYSTDRYYGTTDGTTWAQTMFTSLGTLYSSLPSLSQRQGILYFQGRYIMPHSVFIANTLSYNPDTQFVVPTIVTNPASLHKFIKVRSL